jgi:hypothetical protein
MTLFYGASVKMGLGKTLGLRLYLLVAEPELPSYARDLRLKYIKGGVLPYLTLIMNRYVRLPG